ncbi:MAG: response regulator [Anaerolineae bacterium]
MAAILVVEDEREIRELLQRVLGRDGHRVRLAAHGLEALQALQGDCFDLILCNVRMPVMDGLAFFARLQQVDPILAQHTIFCTGDLVSPEIRLFLSGCRPPVLPKPFTIGELRSLVARSLQDQARVGQAKPTRLELCPAVKT